MVSFGLSVPERVVFGSGEARRTLPQVLEWGRKVLLVTGSRPGRVGWAFDLLAEHGATVAHHPVSGEPRVDDLLLSVEMARGFGAESVVAIGGGSAIDLAKAVAALSPHAADPLDHLEVVGRGLPLPGPGLPCAAFPTTAGTGAEATRNAVLSTGSVKVSLRGPQLMPRLSVVDPDLCLGLPRETTAWCALDALTQLIEPLVSRFSNPACDALCREAIPRLVRALPVALSEPGNLEARSDLSLASLFSGIALANAKLGAVHGLAGPLGGRFPASHGALCARLLVAVWKANVAALERDSHPALERFREAARLLSGRPDAILADGARVLDDLRNLAGAEPLSRWGMTESDIPAVREDGMRASSMKGNPVDLSPEEIDGILREALGSEPAA